MGGGCVERGMRENGEGLREVKQGWEKEKNKKDRDGGSRLRGRIGQAGLHHLVVLVHHTARSPMTLWT